MSFFTDFAPIISSGISAGASLLGSREVSRASTQAADRTAEVAQRIYDTSRADLAPYRDVGVQSLNRLRDIYLTGNVPFTASPGYDFRLQEGINARDRSAAARGMLLSGAQQKAIESYGQGLASDEYGAGFNRLAALAGIGQTATGQSGAAGVNYGNALGSANQFNVNAAQARRSGFEDVGSSIIGGIENQLTLEALRNPNQFGGQVMVLR